MDNEENGQISVSNETLSSQLDALSILLTDEEFVFCEKYLKKRELSTILDNTSASRKGQSFLTNPNVTKYLELRRKAIRSAVITEDDVLLQLLDVFDKCKSSRPVLNKKGQPTGDFIFDSKGAIRALELIMNHLNMLNKDKDKQVNDHFINSTPVIVTKEAMETACKNFNAEY
jgi:phage terminase small subunit